MDVTPSPYWLVALIGGCVEAAEYARGYADPRAALDNASDTHRKWLQRQLDGAGAGCGGGYGDGDGDGGGSGGGSGGCGGGYGDGDGTGRGGGYGDGGSGYDGYGDGGCGGGCGNGDGSGYGYALPLRVRVGGEWWDRDRALVWIAEALK